MLESMSSSELVYWQTKYTEEFLGDTRADYRAARIESAVKNFAGKHLVDGIEINPLECMPYLKKAEQPKKRRKSRKAIARQVHAVFGAFVTAQQQGKR